MAKMTPPLHTSGRYTLKHPWITKADALYSCMAIRDFADLQQRGIDLFTEFYEPVGLSQADLQADLDAGASLITLMSETEPVIRVPDTYILSYPNLNHVTYNHVVLSLSLGALPDFLSLEFLKDQVTNAVSDTLGVTPEVLEHIAPSVGVVTPEEHERLEVARLSAIKTRTTEYAQKLTLQRQNERLMIQIKALEKIVMDNGLLG